MLNHIIVTECKHDVLVDVCHTKMIFPEEEKEKGGGGGERARANTKYVLHAVATTAAAMAKY